MPTLAGLRRRGVPPAAIRDFCERIGVTKAENSIEMELLDSCIREQMDRQAPRAMVVLRPLKLTLINFAEDGEERLTAPNHPKEESLGQRQLRLSRTLYIDREDFREEANKKYKRLVSGGAVRLRYGYVVRCVEVRKDEQGGIVELLCEYFPDSLAENPADIKVRGVIHWVDAASSVPVEVRLYDRLFSEPYPDRAEDFTRLINPASLVSLADSRAEAALADAADGAGYQFEREGYFSFDAAESTRLGRRVFNRTVTLKDSWVRLDAAGQDE